MRRRKSKGKRSQQIEDGLHSSVLLFTGRLYQTKQAQYPTIQTVIQLVLFIIEPVINFINWRVKGIERSNDLLDQCCIFIAIVSLQIVCVYCGLWNYVLQWKFGCTSSESQYWKTYQLYYAIDWGN